jgi:hypothetical protein
VLLLLLVVFNYKQTLTNDFSFIRSRFSMGETLRCVRKEEVGWRQRGGNLQKLFYIVLDFVLQI